MAVPFSLNFNKWNSRDGFVKNYRLTADLFFVPFEGEFIAYAPLKRLALLVNADTLRVISSVRDGTLKKSPPQVAHVLGSLELLGILNGEPDVFPRAMNVQFSPVCVTLFPTYACNLRCVYCYAMGGEEPAQMPWEIAQAAIDLVCQNAIQQHQESFQVNFHGGGEPTAHWALLVRAVEYARDLAKEHGLQVSSSIATNAVLSEQQVDWLASHMSHIQVSLDGLPDVQNAQRPLASGEGSFDAVRQTLDHLDRLGFSYGIRATVTQAGVHRMGEAVAFLCEHFRPQSLQFEPLFVCGRCLTTQVQAPDPHSFLVEYQVAKEEGARHGAPLFFSGVRLESLNYVFCGAACGGFVVLPEGQVTSCLEVCRPSDPRAAIFFYGHYDRTGHSFVFDQERLDALAQRTVYNISACVGCFMKWHCAGDCLAKSLLRNGDLYLPIEERCWLNRELGARELAALVMQGAAPANHGIEVEILPC